MPYANKNVPCIEDVFFNVHDFERVFFVPLKGLQMYNPFHLFADLTTWVEVSDQVFVMAPCVWWICRDKMRPTIR